MIADANWNPDSEASVTGGYSIGFSLTVLQVVFLLVCFSWLFALHITVEIPKFCNVQTHFAWSLLFLSPSQSYLLFSKIYVEKSECQQLICEILRATPEAASADAAVQTARLASKAPSKEKRQVTVFSYSIRT